jgi:hypothetical protein
MSLLARPGRVATWVMIPLLATVSTARADGPAAAAASAGSSRSRRRRPSPKRPARPGAR